MCSLFLRNTQTLIKHGCATVVKSTQLSDNFLTDPIKENVGNVLASNWTQSTRYPEQTTQTKHSQADNITAVKTNPQKVYF